MREISKRFPPKIVALDRVNLNVEKGEIHCLLGENGAGKTTLMNILYGIYGADQGQILIDEKPVEIRSPKDAIRLGIGMVHQHFLQIKKHTVAENIVLGLPYSNAFFPLRGIREKIQKISNQYGLSVDTEARIWQLSAGEQQRVEIIKALSREISVLILDEPTSILTKQETDGLFQSLKKIVEEGLTIIFITHKLDEVKKLSKRVTVLRKGRYVDTLPTHRTSEQDLANLMVGRDVLFTLEKENIPFGDIVLKVENVSAKDDRKLDALKNITFKLREGEVLGVAGVAGNGQKELIEVLTGLRKSSAGKILVRGINLTNRPPREFNKRGVAHIPEERIERGIVPDLNVAENLALKEYDSDFSDGVFLNRDKIKRNAEEAIKKFDIVTQGIGSPVKLLSGGNIQKLILSRELRGNPQVIIASHPTYGLDVGATEQVRKTILEQRKKRAATLIVSEDLDEILALSDRIAVIYEGRIVKIDKTESFGLEEIGLLMSGIKVMGEKKWS
jgi:simple sugar transport system ATP-binding protein